MYSPDRIKRSSMDEGCGVCVGERWVSGVSAADRVIRRRLATALFYLWISRITWQPPHTKGFFHGKHIYNIYYLYILYILCEKCKFPRQTLRLRLRPAKMRLPPRESGRTEQKDAVGLSRTVGYIWICHSAVYELTIKGKLQRICYIFMCVCVSPNCAVCFPKYVKRYIYLYNIICSSIRINFYGLFTISNRARIYKGAHIWHYIYAVTVYIILLYHA